MDRRISVTSINGLGGYSVERDFVNQASGMRRRVSEAGEAAGGSLAAETKRCE